VKALPEDSPGKAVYLSNASEPPELRSKCESVVWHQGALLVPRSCLDAALGLNPNKKKKKKRKIVSGKDGVKVIITDEDEEEEQGPTHHCCEACVAELVAENVVS
jgi:hypothetical protein